MKQLILAVVIGFVICVTVTGGEDSRAGNKVILDTQSYWRCHFTWCAPLIKTEQGLQPVGMKIDTPLPPHDWMQPNYDDHAWGRTRGPFFSTQPAGRQTEENTTPYLASICLRGKFNVTNPSQPSSLALSLVYRGGVVIYLNGKEVARRHVPAGDIDVLTPAEAYPRAVFVTTEGVLITRRNRKDPDVLERMTQRSRKLSALVLPGSLLVKGVNVLAIEVHRSPYDEMALGQDRSGNPMLLAEWIPLGVLAMELTGSGAIKPNIARPEGMQVWNANPAVGIFDADYGDANEPLAPVKLVGTLNGAFSGHVVVSADQPIKGLLAEVSDLKSVDGKSVILSSAIQLRYLLRGGAELAHNERYPGVRDVRRFDALAEQPPSEVPVFEKQTSSDFKGALRHGALQPVVLTVKVPTDASPGDYEGTLSLNIPDAEVVQVPVHLAVHGWKVPSPQDFKTHVGIMQSPESLALCYNVPLWSDEHFDLIARSFRLISSLGPSTVYVPLLSRTHLGNDQSMVRWVKNPDGTYKRDYGVMERYLDTAIMRIGKPEIICLYAWDLYCEGGWYSDKLWKGHGVPVTFLDASTGELSEVELARYGTPESVEQWRPVYQEIRQLLAARGVADSMMIGLAGDGKPNATAVDFFKQVAPGTSWVVHAHGAPRELHGVPVGYLAHVWGTGFAPDPAIKRNYGWNRQRLVTAFPRYGSGPGALRAQETLGMHRAMAESMLLANLRGFGRTGADFWPVVPGTHNRMVYLYSRYPICNWHQLSLGNSTAAFLSPGEHGPISTIRLEMVREGLQESEARIFIEKALLDESLQAKLGKVLAARCQEVLDSRTRLLRAENPGSLSISPRLSYLGEGWQERSVNLFNAAANVEQALRNR